MEQFKKAISQYKWVLLAGVMVAILVGLITANFHVLQFISYKMQGDVKGVVSILEARKQTDQHQWYFKQGIDYLLEEKVYDEETKKLFESDFELFDEVTKKEIIKGYNRQKLSLPLNKEVMEFLIKHKEDENIKVYMYRMSPQDMENGLFLVYGDKPKISENFIKSLNQILSGYPKPLPFEKFQFSIYELVKYADGELGTQVKNILNKLSVEKTKNNLFATLKNQKIEEEQLVKWIKLFKEVGFISLNEANEFDALYSEICMVRSQYQGMDDEIIELKNKKANVESQISNNQSKISEKQGQISEIQSEINKIEGELDSLTNYAFMPLYVEKPSGTGSNEYIASVPRGGLFGKLGPSSQKYIIKLVNTQFMDQGIYNLNVYLEGSKTTSDGSLYPYYVEVGSKDTQEIEALAAKRDNQQSALNSLKQEITVLQAEVNKIKKENNYDEVVEALDTVDVRRNDYISKINAQVIQIKELLGLNNINISPEGAQK